MRIWVRHNLPVWSTAGDDNDEAEPANDVESRCDVACAKTRGDVARAPSAGDAACANTGGDFAGANTGGDVACAKCGGDVACDKGSPTRVLGRDVVRGTHATLKASRARRAGRPRTFPELGDGNVSSHLGPVCYKL
jgi:hypothetical protein